MSDPVTIPSPQALIATLAETLRVEAEDAKARGYLEAWNTYLVCVGHVVAVEAALSVERSRLSINADWTANGHPPDASADPLRGELEAPYRVGSNGSPVDFQLPTALTSLRGEGPQEDFKALYFELLLAVAKKHPSESRHQTALRYILQAEQHVGGPASEAPVRGSMPSQQTKETEK